MFKIIKKILPFMILGGIEVYFYFYMRINETFKPDTYFFGWGVLWLMFLTFSIMPGSGNSMGGRLLSSRDHRANSAMINAMASDADRRRGMSSLSSPAFMTSINLIYLLLLVSNIVAYIVVTR